jgi:hypothetical protein
MNPYICTSVLLAALAVASFPGTLAQEPSAGVKPIENADALMELQHAQRFISSAYPELSNKPLAITLEKSAAESAIRVAEARSLAQMLSSVVPEVLLEGKLTLSSNGRVTNFAGAGAATELVKNTALRQEMTSKEGWTDSQLKRLLTSSARFGPDRFLEIHQRINLDRWTSVLGQAVVMREVRFQWRESLPRRGGRQMASKPGWLVRASAIASDGRAVTYRLLFEPFSGNLIEIVEE